MGVILGDADGAVAGEDLDGAQGDTGLDEVGTEGVAQAVDAAVQVGALQGAGEAAGQGGGGNLGEDVIPAALEGGQGFLGAVGDGDGAPFAALGAGGGGADDAQFVLADVGPAQLQGFGAAEPAVGQELP